MSSFWGAWQESELVENIYWVINKILKNPNNVIEEYINSKNNSNNSQKYKDEVIENDKILSKNYSKIDELFENFRWRKYKFKSYNSK